MQDTLATNPLMHGAMLTPVVLGTDKTTVSVMTGHQQYHPLYMSLGNFTNDARRAHRDAVMPIAFLAIPKGAVDVHESSIAWLKSPD